MAGHKMTHAGCSIPGSASLCPNPPPSLPPFCPSVKKISPKCSYQISTCGRLMKCTILWMARNLLDLGPFSLLWPPWVRCPAWLSVTKWQILSVTRWIINTPPPSHGWFTIWTRKSHICAHFLSLARESKSSSQMLQRRTRESKGCSCSWFAWNF